MNSILLTGATGFLGSHLLKGLLRNNYRVIILKRKASNTWRIRDEIGGIKFYNVDEESLDNIFQNEKVDAVIHTAGYYGRSEDSILNAIESNLTFSVNLVEHCMKYEVPNFFNTDSFFNAKENPSTYLLGYTLSKKHFVEYLKAFSLTKRIKIFNLKLQHLYGPNDNEDKFIPWLIQQIIEKKESIDLSDGEQKRDFIYVEDVVNAYLTLLEKSLSGAFFEKNFYESDIGTGLLYTVKNMIQVLCEEALKLNLAKPLLNFGAKPRYTGEVESSVANIVLLRNNGWTIKNNLKSGMQKTIESYTNRKEYAN